MSRHTEWPCSVLSAYGPTIQVVWKQVLNMMLIVLNLPEHVSLRTTDLQTMLMTAESHLEMTVNPLTDMLSCVRSCISREGTALGHPRTEQVSDASEWWLASWRIGMVPVCLCPVHRNRLREIHAVDMQAHWRYTSYRAFFKWAEVSSCWKCTT